MIFEFENSHFDSINNDLSEFIQVVKQIRGGKRFRMILTVSPVPLAATAGGHHALTSTTYSKSTLRVIAALWAEQPFIDYYPSYEIVNNPRLHSTAFSDNLRSIRDETIETVMRHFLKSTPSIIEIFQNLNQLEYQVIH